MFTAYIVDDEALSLRFLRANVDWYGNGFEVIGQAERPEKAVEEILASAPDVVLTDLKMPGMSGVELIETLIARRFQAEFVIISAHSDFFALRRLMVAQGCDYLLKPVQPQEFDALFIKLIDRLNAKHALEKAETPSEDLNRILHYIAKNLQKKQTLGGIALQFAMNPNSVCRLFSKHLNTTFIKYVTNLRMERAAEMLRDTNRSIKEIALYSGYDDYFYFCRIFKDTFGCTPTAYREKERRT